MCIIVAWLVDKSSQEAFKNHLNMANLREGVNLRLKFAEKKTFFLKHGQFLMQKIIEKSKLEIEGNLEYGNLSAEDFEDDEIEASNITEMLISHQKNLQKNIDFSAEEINLNTSDVTTR